MASGPGDLVAQAGAKGLALPAAQAAEPLSSDIGVPITRAAPALLMSRLVTFGKSLALKNLRACYRASAAQQKKQMHVIRTGKEELKLPLFILNMVFYKGQENITNLLQCQQGSRTQINIQR